MSLVNYPDYQRAQLEKAQALICSLSNSEAPFNF